MTKKMQREKQREDKEARIATIKNELPGT